MSTTITTIQPDISYHPDYTKFQLRTERLKPSRPANPQLPHGFPHKLTGPLVWEAKDFEDESEWTLVLTSDHLSEIHEALIHFKCKQWNTIQGQMLQS